MLAAATCVVEEVASVVPTEAAVFELIAADAISGGFDIVATGDLARLSRAAAATATSKGAGAVSFTAAAAAVLPEGAAAGLPATDVDGFAAAAAPEADCPPATRSGAE